MFCFVLDARDVLERGPTITVGTRLEAHLVKIFCGLENTGGVKGTRIFLYSGCYLWLCIQVIHPADLSILGRRFSCGHILGSGPPTQSQDPCVADDLVGGCTLCARREWTVRKSECMIDYSATTSKSKVRFTDLGKSMSDRFGQGWVLLQLSHRCSLCHHGRDAQGLLLE